MPLSNKFPPMIQKRSRVVRRHMFVQLVIVAETPRSDPPRPLTQDRQARPDSGFYECEPSPFPFNERAGSRTGRTQCECGPSGMC